MTYTGTGVIKYNHPIKKYNSWRVGGEVKCCYWPSDRKDLISFIQKLPATEKVIMLGLGSNVLFADSFLDATVIMTSKVLTNYSDTAAADGGFMFEAGVSCAKVAKIVCRHGFNDGAFFAGIPGTVGGALRMNAGAFGGETWKHVVSVEYLARTGNITELTPANFNVGYRSVTLPEPGWFIAAKFGFVKSSAKNAPECISKLLQKRGETQPIGSFNCGSVFKNPECGYAAAYIEDCGLKGKVLGGAMVSPKHANFIINDNNATPDDIIKLMRLIQDEVKIKHDVHLEPEVQIFTND